MCMCWSLRTTFTRNRGRGLIFDLILYWSLISIQLSSRFLSLLRENSSLDRLHLRRVGEYSQQVRRTLVVSFYPYFIVLIRMYWGIIISSIEISNRLQEMIRPGFTRISIPYFENDQKVKYYSELIFDLPFRGRFHTFFHSIRRHSRYRLPSSCKWLL